MNDDLYGEEPSTEYGVGRVRTGEPHREGFMTEAAAREWICEFEKDGGKPGVFVVICRTIGSWELRDSPAYDTVPPELSDEARARIKSGEAPRRRHGYKAFSAEGAPHESDGVGSFCGQRTPDPPTGAPGPVPPAPQHDADASDTEGPTSNQ